MATTPLGTMYPLPALVNNFVQKCYKDLDELTKTLPQHNDQVRKERIRQFLQRYRAVSLRLLVLVKWCERTDEIQKCQEILECTQGQQSNQFAMCAGYLKNFHSMLWEKRAPVQAIPTAVDVLTTGDYSRFPLMDQKEMWEDEKPLTRGEKLSAFLALDNLLRARLAYSKIPEAMVVRVVGGRAYLHVKGEYEVGLTLWGHTMDTPWRLLTLRFLFRPPNDEKAAQVMRESIALNVIRELQQRLAANENAPLSELHEILHFYSMSLQLVILQKQAAQLLKDRWAGSFGLSYQAGQSLTLYYWTNMPRAYLESAAWPPAVGTDTSKGQVYIKVRLQTVIESDGSLGPMVVDHVPPIHLPGREHSPALSVEDMLTFEGDDSVAVLNVEALVTRAVYIHTHTRIRELAKQLKANTRLFDAPDEDIRVVEGGAHRVWLEVSYTPGRNVEVSVDAQNGHLLLRDGVDEASQGLMSHKLNEEIKKDPGSLPRIIVMLRQLARAQAICDTAKDLHTPHFRRLPITTKLELPKMAVEGEALPEAAGLKDMTVFIALSNRKGSYVCARISPNDTDYHLLETKPSATGPLLLDVASVRPLDSVRQYNFTTGLAGSSLSAKRPAKRRRLSFIQAGAEEQGDQGEAGPMNLLKDEVKRVMVTVQVQIDVDRMAQLLHEAGLPFAKMGEAEKSGFAIQILDMPPVGEEPQAVGKRKFLFGTRDAQEAIKSVLLRLLHTDGVSEFAWEVETHLAATVLEARQVTNVGHVRYIPQSNVVLFRYRAIDKTNMELFLSDWSRFIYVTRLAFQYRLFLRGAPVSEPLRQFFQLGNFNHVALQFNYGDLEQGPLESVTIRWVPERSSFSVSFGEGGVGRVLGELKYFLEAQLNQTRNLRGLMETLHATAPVVWALAAMKAKAPAIPWTYEHEPTGESNVAPSAHRQPTLWAAVGIVPRNARRLRIVFGDMFAVDVQSPGSGIVLIGDTLPGPAGDKSLGLQPLPDLVKFCLAHVANLAGSSVPEVQSVPSPSRVRLPDRAVSTLLPALQSYACSVQLLAALDAGLRHKGISTAMSPVKLEYRGDNDLLYALCVEASGRIAFDDHQAIFTEEQNRAFGEYLNQAASKMRSGAVAEASISSLCTVLTLPHTMFAELMSVFTSQMIGDARGPHVSLFLTMPPTITAKHLPPIGSPSILQSEKTLCFVVRLTSLSGGRFVDIAMQYNGMRNRLTGWDTNFKGQTNDTGEIDQPTCPASEVLASIAKQDFDPSSGSVIRWTIDKLLASPLDQLMYPIDKAAILPQPSPISNPPSFLQHTPTTPAVSITPI